MLRMAYVPKFTVKSRVQIAERALLQKFMRPHYRFHNPVTTKHLRHAGEIHSVVSVGMYHGGDQLYVLDEIPGIVWHEECLSGNEPS